VKKYILAALEGCRAIVSVDTNFLNWVRASLPGHAGNIVYVPNFVDTARFRPEEPAGAALRPATRRTEVSRAVLLYPRRVSAERGTATMMGLASRFLEAYPGVEVVFAGVGNRQSQDYRDFLNWLSGHPHRDRIRHIAAGPEEMPGIYRRADIVVIPSPCCEGTSLSCLEAMATGKAVVATNVGGLPNLILDGYNGLLVTPDQASVGEAVDRLIRDPGLCWRLGEKARETSQVFCLERWEERWARLIERVYGKRGG
jgi:glycosyltransferase involved in cell wall biosynthesis